MSVLFTGFSGLQTAAQHALLINQDTWCVSFFFRLASGSSTDSELMNQTFLMTCQPTYPQATTIHNLTTNTDVSSTPSPNRLMQFSLMKAYDPSLIGIQGSVVAGGKQARTWTSGVDAFASHHVLMYGIPTQLVDQNNPDSGYTQGLFMFVDGSPVDSLDQDVGVGHNDWSATGGPSAIDPYFPADTTKSPDFSIRLGNPNMIQLWPGWFGPSYASGQVSFSLEHFAIWHSWTPSASNIVALRDRSKLPSDFSSGLQTWWKLDSTSGTVSGSDTAIQNSASGSYNLSLV